MLRWIYKKTISVMTKWWSYLSRFFLWIEQRILLFRGFIQALNISLQAGWLLAYLAYLLFHWHIFFSSNRSICCISSSFERSKANWLIRIKESSTLEKILSLLDYHCLTMSAFFTLDRDGQIPTPYPSSTFTVPQCQFALRAITLTMIHVGTLPLSASLPQAPCQNSRV